MVIIGSWQRLWLFISTTQPLLLALYSGAFCLLTAISTQLTSEQWQSFGLMLFHATGGLVSLVAWGYEWILLPIKTVLVGISLWCNTRIFSPLLSEAVKFFGSVYIVVFSSVTIITYYLHRQKKLADLLFWILIILFIVGELWFVVLTLSTFAMQLLERTSQLPADMFSSFFRNLFGSSRVEVVTTSPSVLFDPLPAAARFLEIASSETVAVNKTNITRTRSGFPLHVPHQWKSAGLWLFERVVNETSAFVVRGAACIEASAVNVPFPLMH